MNAEQIELVYAMENCISKEKNILEKTDISNKVIDLLINRMINKHKYNFPTNISELIKFMKTENMDKYWDDEYRIARTFISNTYFKKHDRYRII